MENGHDEYEGTERRNRLSEKEIGIIKDQLLESIYADIGKSIVKKFLWVVGATTVALVAWLNHKDIL